MWDKIREKLERRREKEKKMWDRPEKQEFSRLRREKSLKTEELLRAKTESMKIYDGF